MECLNKSNGFIELEDSQLNDVNGGMPLLAVVPLCIFLVGCSSGCEDERERRQ